MASHDRNTIVFPLWIHQTDKANDALDLGDVRRLNLSQRFREALAKQLQVPLEDGLPRGISADDLFAYMYALLHSEMYRERYGEFLRIDFPRIFIPAQKKLFDSLATLGQKLVALHLMKSPELDGVASLYNGPDDPEVGRVSWQEEIVWLDSPRTKAETKGGAGGNFTRVPSEVWGFQIGGYQVCEKWLKEGKGRRLSESDLNGSVALSWAGPRRIASLLSVRSCERVR